MACKADKAVNERKLLDDPAHRQDRRTNFRRLTTAAKRNMRAERLVVHLRETGLGHQRRQFALEAQQRGQWFAWANDDVPFDTELIEQNPEPSTPEPVKRRGQRREKLRGNADPVFKQEKREVQMLVANGGSIGAEQVSQASQFFSDRRRRLEAEEQSVNVSGCCPALIKSVQHLRFLARLVLEHR